MRVPFVDLQAQICVLRVELDAVLSEVVSSGEFVNGHYNEVFCANFAEFLGVGHCIGVGNGTDGLEIALLALGIGAGDEVIVPANSFTATAEAVCNVGARVVFADCLRDYYTIDPADVERKINSKTRCIIPVHLYGLPANMVEIMRLARRYKLRVVEDCAQAHGAKFAGKNVGGFGDLGVFSFYPGKNLGAFGDGGAVVTNSARLAKKVQMIANHGRIAKYDHEIVGRNSRLDNLQAAVLNVKLKYLSEWNRKRAMIAEWYNELLQSVPGVITPKVAARCEHVYHLYVVRVENREAVAGRLRERGVAVGVHYPIGLPYLKAFRYLGHKTRDFPVCSEYQGKVLSLPMYAEMGKEQVEWICGGIIDN